MGNVDIQFLQHTQKMEQFNTLPLSRLRCTIPYLDRTRAQYDITEYRQVLTYLYLLPFTVILVVLKIRYVQHWKDPVTHS